MMHWKVSYIRNEARQGYDLSFALFAGQTIVFRRGFELLDPMSREQYDEYRSCVWAAVTRRSNTEIPPMEYPPIDTTYFELRMRILDPAAWYDADSLVPHVENFRRDFEEATTETQSVRFDGNVEGGGPITIEKIMRLRELMNEMALRDVEDLIETQSQEAVRANKCIDTQRDVVICDWGRS